MFRSGYGLQNPANDAKPANDLRTATVSSCVRGVAHSSAAGAGVTVALRLGLSPRHVAGKRSSRIASRTAAADKRERVLAGRNVAGIDAAQAEGFQVPRQIAVAGARLGECTHAVQMRN
jgi:hypothetical protein